MAVKSIKLAKPIKLLGGEYKFTNRRGAPMPGCDCMQCFGYCEKEQDKAARGLYLRHSGDTTSARALVTGLLANTLDDMLKVRDSDQDSK